MLADWEWSGEVTLEILHHCAVQIIFRDFKMSFACWMTQNIQMIKQLKALEYLQLKKH